MCGHARSIPFEGGGGGEVQHTGGVGLTDGESRSGFVRSKWPKHEDATSFQNLPSRIEIVKRLVGNSLMKGWVLKVKLIYVPQARSQSCSVISRECSRSHGGTVAPNSPLTDETVNKRGQRRPPPFAEVLGGPGAAEGNSWHVGAPRGTAAWEEEEEEEEEDATEQ